MATIGTKYQMVIERKARELLGIEPGWEAVQIVVGDRLEVRFLPPEHDKSLAGSLRRYVKRPATAYSEEKREAWDQEVTQRRPRASTPVGRRQPA